MSEPSLGPNEPSTSSLLARDAMAGELSWTTLRRCQQAMSRLVSQHVWLLPPKSSSHELVDEGIDSLRKMIRRNRYVKQEGASQSLFIRLLDFAGRELRRREGRRSRLRRPDTMARINSAPYEIRRRAEQLVRSRTRTPDRWDVYELYAHGVRGDHNFFGAEELRSAGVGRPSIAAMLTRGGSLPACDPMDYNAIRGLLPIPAARARQYVKRTAEAVEQALMEIARDGHESERSGDPEA